MSRLAVGQFFGLIDPAFTLDTTFEVQLLAEFFGVCVAPSGDLGEAGHAGFVQFLLKRGTNTRQLLQVVATGSSLGRGLLGFRGVAGASAGIAKILIFIVLVGLLLMLLFGVLVFA